MDTLQAIGEPSRRRIVEMIAGRGSLSATEISDGFKITPQAVSQHLRILREARVVRVERRRQQRIYMLNPHAVEELEQWTAGLKRLWERRLYRLEKFLKAGGGR